jgi:Flp pilus assembly protein TadG
MTHRLVDFVDRLRARTQQEAGSALVELALSVPILLMLLLGAVEFGRFAYLWIEVTNAARAAAQYAATNGGASGDSTGIQLAAQQDAPGLGSNVTATVYSDVCVCSDAETTTVSCGGTTNSCTTPGSHLMETVTIKTSATYTPLVNYSTPKYGISGISGPFTLHGYASQLVLPQ